VNSRCQESKINVHELEPFLFYVFAKLILFNRQIYISAKVFPDVDKQALRDSCAMWKSLCGGKATLWNSSMPDLKLVIADSTFSA
jgi:hypothetical protein